jgi:hypothetical protein
MIAVIVALKAKLVVSVVFRSKAHTSRINCFVSRHFPTHLMAAQLADPFAFPFPVTRLELACLASIGGAPQTAERPRRRRRSHGRRRRRRRHPQVGKPERP